MNTFSKMLCAFGVALVGMIHTAQAVEVGGKPMPDSVKVGGKDLKLNGYGVRTAMMGLAKV